MISKSIGSDAWRALVARLDDLYGEFAVDGRVRFDYDTSLYLGPLAP